MEAINKSIPEADWSKSVCFDNVVQLAYGHNGSKLILRTNPMKIIHTIINLTKNKAGNIQTIHNRLFPSRQI